MSNNSFNHNAPGYSGNDDPGPSGHDSPGSSNDDNPEEPEVIPEPEVPYVSRYGMANAKNVSIIIIIDK